jgi:hypothetical protein
MAHPYRNTSILNLYGKGKKDDNKLLDTDTAAQNDIEREWNNQAT